MEITLKLTVDQANTILKYLGNGAYVEVESVINAIRQQANEQIITQAKIASEDTSNG